MLQDNKIEIVFSKKSQRLREAELATRQANRLLDELGLTNLSADVRWLDPDREDSFHFLIIVWNPETMVRDSGYTTYRTAVSMENIEETIMEIASNEYVSPAMSRTIETLKEEGITFSDE